MISFWEAREKVEHPLETNKYTPPPWITVPAVAGVAAVGGYKGAKHGAEKLVAAPIKKLARGVSETQPFKGIKTLIKGMQGKPLEEVISVGLLVEINRRQMYKRAASKALLRGQKRIIKNPADPVGRGLVDGGNILRQRATGTKALLRTVS